MEVESLEIAIETVLIALEKAEINKVDKIELMMNLSKFLKEYNNNINTLKKKYNGTLF